RKGRATRPAGRAASGPRGKRRHGGAPETAPPGGVAAHSHVVGVAENRRQATFPDYNWPPGTKGSGPAGPAGPLPLTRFRTLLRMCLMTRLRVAALFLGLSLLPLAAQEPARPIFPSAPRDGKEHADAAFPVPEMTPKRADVKPFEYTEVGKKIP